MKEQTADYFNEGYINFLKELFKRLNWDCIQEGNTLIVEVPETEEDKDFWYKLGIYDLI